MRDGPSEERCGRHTFAYSEGRSHACAAAHPQQSDDYLPIVAQYVLKPIVGAEPKVLYPRQHEHFIFAIHLNQFLNRDASRQIRLVDCHFIVIE